MEAQKKSRNVNVYTVPESIASETGVNEVGMVQLTTEEELLCFKRAKGDNARLASELSKTSLVEAMCGEERKALSLSDGTADTFWKDVDPKLRQLIMGAYAELHAAPEEDQEAFLKSRKIRAA